MIRKALALLLIAAQLCAPAAQAALSDYNPTFQMYFDDLVDTEEPTGLTKGAAGALGDPTVAGSPDAYYDCDGTNDGVLFTTATPPGEVGTGDITFVFKAQLDTSTAGDVLMEFYDGSGTVDTAAGIQIVNSTGTSRTVGMAAPPTAYTAERISNTNNALTLGTPFIMAIRRSSATWSMWLDVDASGDMTSHTPAVNSIATNTVFSELGDFAFCSTRAGTVPFDGRLYWVIIIEGAVTDADLQLAAWGTESTLKSTWLGSGGSSSLVLFRRRH